MLPPRRLFPAPETSQCPRRVALPPKSGHSRLQLERRLGAKSGRLRAICE